MSSENYNEYIKSTNDKTPDYKTHEEEKKRGLRLDAYNSLSCLKRVAFWTLVICIVLSFSLHPAILICHVFHCPIKIKVLLSIIKDYRYSIFHCSFLAMSILGIYFGLYNKIVKG